jgi:N-acylglucosamine-6-phosphate 2-epimerase
MRVDNSILPQLKSQLIVSCQAPKDSPIFAKEIIGAIAQACVMRGAGGLRLDTPEHVEYSRNKLPDIPIIGLWKREYPGYQVYITPCWEDAKAIAQAGADIIAIDATLRKRPEPVAQLVEQIHRLGKLVMADIDSLESAIAAVEAGADLVGTTLYGYTDQTRKFSPPGYELLAQSIANVSVGVICEGGIATPEMAKKALDMGAYCVVVGNAITGIDLKMESFSSMISSQMN